MDEASLISLILINPLQKLFQGFIGNQAVQKNTSTSSTSYFYCYATINI